MEDNVFEDLITEINSNLGALKQGGPSSLDWTRWFELVNSARSLLTRQLESVGDHLKFDDGSTSVTEFSSHAEILVSLQSMSSRIIQNTDDLMDST
jgi:hypothetical protein